MARAVHGFLARGGTGRHLNTVFEEFWNVRSRRGEILLRPAKLFPLIDATLISDRRNFNRPSKLRTKIKKVQLNSIFYFKLLLKENVLWIIRVYYRKPGSQTKSSRVSCIIPWVHPLIVYVRYPPIALGTDNVRCTQLG